jgi:glycerol kinase
MRMHFPLMQATESSQMPNLDLLLGLDVGTTNIKCLALDSTGKILFQADERTPLSHPKPGWTDFIELATSVYSKFPA